MNFLPTEDQQLAVERFNRFLDTELQPTARRYQPDKLIDKEQMLEIFRMMLPYGMGSNGLISEAWAHGHAVAEPRDDERAARDHRLQRHHEPGVGSRSSRSNLGFCDFGDDGPISERRDTTLRRRPRVNQSGARIARPSGGCDRAGAGLQTGGSVRGRGQIVSRRPPSTRGERRRATRHWGDGGLGNHSGPLGKRGPQLSISEAWNES